MSDYAMFYNSVGNDRTYDADDLTNWLKKFFTSGVFNGDLQVSPAGGLKVKVDTGYVNIGGKVREFNTVTELSLDAPDSSFFRYDTIVVERNDILRDITIKVVKGDQTGLPTEPVRENGVYQLVLAQIRVNSGVTAIQSIDIKDTRTDTSICGVVVSTVTQYDFDTFKRQYDSFFESEKDGFVEWLSTLKDLGENRLGVTYTEEETYELPVHTINDALTATTSTWSSSKINETMDEKLEKVNEFIDEMAVTNTFAYTTGTVAYYVDSLNGNDDNDGSKEKPFKSMIPLYKLINKGNCNLRIGFFYGVDGKYDFECFTLANTNIHFSLAEAKSVTLNFKPVPEGLEQIAFYNCHLNFKGRSSDVMFKVTCSSPKGVYFDSGNMALTYVKWNFCMQFYHSGALISGSDINAINAICSSVRVTSTVMGAVNSYDSVIGLTDVTLSTNRVTGLNEGKDYTTMYFLNFRGGTFYIGGTSKVSGIPAYGHFMYLANTFTSISSTLTAPSVSKHTGGSKISNGVFVCQKYTELKSCDESWANSALSKVS